MNAEELMKAARKRADYDGSVVSILKQGLDDQKKIVMELEGEEREQAADVLKILYEAIEDFPRASRIVIALVAFEIQIENAQQRQSDRNN
jgi:hypothetical protein